MFEVKGSGILWMPSNVEGYCKCAWGMIEFLNSIDLYVNYIQVLTFLIPASFRNCLSLSVGTKELNQ